MKNKLRSIEEKRNMVNLLGILFLLVFGVLISFSVSLNSFSSSIRLALYVIILIYFILFIGATAYMINTYLVPLVRFGKATKTEDRVVIFYKLEDKLKQESKKDKKKAKEVYNRMVHFYNYMSDEEKEKVKKEMQNLEKYINKAVLVSK